MWSEHLLIKIEKKASGITGGKVSMYFLHEEKHK